LVQLVGIYMAPCKNLSGRGRLGRSAAPNFYFETPIGLPLSSWDWTGLNTLISLFLVFSFTF